MDDFLSPISVSFDILRKGVNSNDCALYKKHYVRDQLHKSSVVRQDLSDKLDQEPDAISILVNTINRKFLFKLTKNKMFVMG